MYNGRALDRPVYRFLRLLFLLGLAVPLAIAQLQSLPGYMDADYYFGGGIQLAQGNGFNEPYLLAQEGLRAWELARERAALKEEVARARAEVERLKEEVRAARDPAYLEALLRRMGWVRKDEEVRRWP